CAHEGLSFREAVGLPGECRCSHPRRRSHHPHRMKSPCHPSSLFLAKPQYTRRHVNLWIPDRADRDAVGELSEQVTLNLIPGEGELPRAILDAEFLVPSSDNPRVLDLLGTMSKLRVIQTLSAGVD